VSFALVAGLKSALTPLVARELLASIIALAVTFIVWRLGYAITDRFFSRRFVSRFIPRVKTFSELTKSIISFIVVLAAILVLLNIWAVNVTAAVWSAGIVTAALAFGAQALVRDVLAGFSALLEDQYDVGDVVELVTTVNSTISGTVEAVGLRTTRLIDDRGRHVFVPNGAVLYSVNVSRMPNRASFSISLPLRAPVDQMRAKVESIIADAATAAGIGDGRPTVIVADISADSATFSADFRAPFAESGAKIAAVRERVTRELQLLGWLPGGSGERST
jgi:small conductance mechanosensitive channel